MTDKNRAIRDAAFQRIDDRYDEFMTVVNEIPLSRILFRPMFNRPLGSGFYMWRMLFIVESVQVFIEFVCQQQSVDSDNDRQGRQPITVATMLAVNKAYQERVEAKKFGAIPFVAHKFGLSTGSVWKIVSKKGFKVFEPLHADIEIAVKASVLPLVYNIIETPQVSE